VNGEVRGWVLGSTPLGCLIRCVVLLVMPIVLALWGFDQTFTGKRRRLGLARR
jgi:hypothetical protein